MHEEKVFFKNSKAQKLGGLLYKPEGNGPFPAVVLIHGFGGGVHEIKNKYMCKTLAEAGFVAFMFDFYDKPNNLSEPNIENMLISQQANDTKLAIDFIEKQPFVDKNRIGLTGHSLGGLTVILYTPSDNRIKALVLQSSVTEFANTKTFRIFESEEWKDKDYVILDKSWGKLKLNKSFYEEGLNYDTFRIAEKIKCPILVFHGDQDESVFLSHAQKLIKHLKPKDKLVVIRGADHCYYNGDTLKEATKLLIDWFIKHLK